MGIPDTIKSMYEVLKAADRLDLAEQFNDIKSELLDVKEKNIELKEKVSELEKQLELKSKVIFDKGICWIEDDEMTANNVKTPICPQCYQVDKVVNRLIIQSHQQGRQYVQCLNCKARSYIE